MKKNKLYHLGSNSKTEGNEKNYDLTVTKDGRIIPQEVTERSSFEAFQKLVQKYR